MKSIQNSLLTSLVFVVGCGVGGVSSQLVLPPAHAGQVQKWEHFCFEGIVTEEINLGATEAGTDGWEMVSSGGIGTINHTCFKRRL